MLSLEVFRYLVELFQVLDIDMFASRLNKQLANYASWMPDNESYINDCMSTSLENTYIYVFKSFSMIWPTNKKIEKETEKALIIVPMWSTENWFTWALELVTAAPIIIESQHLHLPDTSKQYLPCLKLKLMVICYSKNKHQQIEFSKRHKKSFAQPRHHRLNASTNQYSKNRRIFVVKGVPVLSTQMK